MDGGNLAPTILKEKHELFAFYLAQGKSQADAYGLAGFSKNVRGGTASALARNPRIAARVRELVVAKQRTELESREWAIAKLGLETYMILADLAALAFSNMGDYVDLKTGKLGLEKLTKRQRAAIKKLKINEWLIADGVTRRETEIELHDKRGPLLDLAKYMGMFIGYAENGAQQSGELPIATVNVIVNGGERKETITLNARGEILDHKGENAIAKRQSQISENPVLRDVENAGKTLTVKVKAKRK